MAEASNEKGPDPLDLTLLAAANRNSSFAIGNFLRLAAAPLAEGTVPIMRKGALRPRGWRIKLSQ